MNVTFEYLQDAETVKGQYYKTGVTTFIFLDNKENEVVYLTAVGKCDCEKITHVFDNDNGEVLEDNYIYFVKVTDLNGNIIVEENTRIYCVDDVPHTKAYGVCGSSKCKVPVLPMKNIVVLTAKADGNTKVIFNYPEGFNENNCVVLAIEHYNSSGKYWWNYISDWEVKYKSDCVEVSDGLKNVLTRIVLLRFV